MFRYVNTFLFFAIAIISFLPAAGCYTLTDLMCHNHRCIPKMLRCDGFDHCGDNSDEPSSCYRGGDKNLTPEDAAWWYQHTPNYYFPQKNNLFGGAHGWSSILLLVSLVGESSSLLPLYLRLLFLFLYFQ